METINVKTQRDFDVLIPSIRSKSQNIERLPQSLREVVEPVLIPSIRSKSQNTIDRKFV